MKVLYDIAVPPVETLLSNNRLKVTYTYVFYDDKDTEHETKIVKSKRRFNWEVYDSDSVVYYGAHTHLWVYTVYYRRKKPFKRIFKRD